MDSSESGYSTQSPPYQPKRIALWMFYGSVSLYWGALYVYSPILSVYAQSMGASFAMVGMVVGAYGFVQMLLRIPLGIWSDRLGKRHLFIYAGHFFNLVGCLGLALSPSAAYLIVFRGVLGISAATWVVFTVLYASYFAADETPKAMGIVTAINGGSLIAVNWLGGQIAQSWGMAATFYAGAGLAVLGLGATVSIEEHRVDRKPPTPRQIWRIMTRPTLIITASVTALNQYAFWATTFSFVPLYANALGASKLALGVLGVISLAPYTVAALVNDRLARRLRENRAAFLGMLVMATMMFAVPAIDSVPLLSVSQGVSGFGRGMVYPLLMGLSIREIPTEDRATAMGVFQAIYAIGMFSGPMTAGVLADALGLSGAFIIAGTVSFTAALLALVLLKRVAKSSRGSS